MSRRRAPSEFKAGPSFLEVVSLTMHNGETITLPTRERYETREDGEVATIHYADFSHIADPETGQPPRCPRCGGHASRSHTMPGCVEGGLLLVTIPKSMGDESVYDYEYVCACDCVFGAWRHAKQRYGYADDQIGAKPPELSLEVDLDMSRRMTEAQIKHSREEIRKIVEGLAKTRHRGGMETVAEILSRAAGSEHALGAQALDGLCVV